MLSQSITAFSGDQDRKPTADMRLADRAAVVRTHRGIGIPVLPQALQGPGPEQLGHPLHLTHFMTTEDLEGRGPAASHCRCSAPT